ncbi:phosphoribosylformylglycinamidine synthase subunit PurL [Candidatus Woesearchaeota archaeon]|nr:phosphoribosylformylglycinamidine synthase subunit PurL [Candidatus Woesearchaeota archaeon]
MRVDDPLIPITDFSDEQLLQWMKQHGIVLKANEARRVVELIGRNPTITELHIFNIQWSEHSSYKSSRKILKQLPTSGSNVILGPKEDAGIVEFATLHGERYGIVVSHESHNHPSQVVPFEGAATGVGGNIRDVLCMGAKVLAIADPLRFGNPQGEQQHKVKYIANEVIKGIAGYGNPLGIPNLAGDAHFSDGYDGNCLVNVVTLGLVKEKDIIHSSAPPHADGYDIILIGKATDNSGFGGAAFASLVLDEKDKDANKGAVQVPDPFLKNVLLRATYAVFEEARKHNIVLGFKDLGAGGIMCSTSELCQSGGFGCTLDLDKVHVSMELPSFMIACSETQERFCWISPPSFTRTILKMYNETFALPDIAEQARASVIGKVTREKKYLITSHGNIVCNVPIDAVTSGISYDRERKKPSKHLVEPSLAEPQEYRSLLLHVLSHPNVCCKKSIYHRYDTHVLGLTIIPSGMADAGVMAPLHGEKPAVALSVDSNPFYNRISAYHGAMLAVAEAMRNVAAVGAVPACLTDCLCYGNPEVPEVFDDFCEGVRGIADAAKNLPRKGTTEPVPVISGNVSFYNDTKGKPIDPSPIIACVGILDDYSKAITLQLKHAGSKLFLIGKRKDEMGGSVYYQLHSKLGKQLPLLDFAVEKKQMDLVIDLINQRLVLSCHDISDGGLLSAVVEMMLGGDADGTLGVELLPPLSALPLSRVFFSETPGFVLEIPEQHAAQVYTMSAAAGVELIPLGKVIASPHLKVSGIFDVPLEELRSAWTTEVLS